MPSSGSRWVGGWAVYWANARSRPTPMMRVFLQMWLFPGRHWRQGPHIMWPSAVTSCPVRSSARAPPTATISPANSCPTTTGGRRRPSAHAFQSAMCRSVTHTPEWRTAMSTSPGPGDGLGTVVTLRPGARFSLTMACIETRDARCEMRDALEDRPREAAVDLQHGARNIAGAFGYEERDRRRELLGAAHARHGNAGDQLSHHVLGRPLLAFGPRFRQLRDPLRRDETGAHDVDRDTVRGHLVRQRLREAEHTGAGCGREDQAGQRLLGGDRGEAHDPPPLELAHERHRGAAQMDHGEQVELYGLLKRLGALVTERRGGRAARIAEQHVEPAQLMVHPLHQACGLRRDAHVRRERCDALAGLRRELVGGARRRVVVAAVDRYEGPPARQGLRDGATQALPTAPPQRDATRETEVHKGAKSTGARCRVSGVGCRVPGVRS